jgi:phosphopentomutase
MADAGLDVIGVGKIKDIFNGSGITESHKIEGNLDGMKITAELLQKKSRGLIFTNLVDFDMVFGHRNDVKGYANALEELDAYLPNILSAMKPDDVIFITADHGCDPTTPSTDHSREYVPLLVYSPSIKKGGGLGLRKSFADVGKTIAGFFGLDDKLQDGESFAHLLMQESMA